MTTLTHLECSLCKRIFETSGVRGRCDCGGVLLARYDLMTLITEVEEHAGRPDHTPNVWLLLPTTHQGLPVIDGVAVPIVNNIQNTRTLALAQAWVENKHRAGIAS